MMVDKYVYRTQNPACSTLNIMNEETNIPLMRTFYVNVVSFKSNSSELKYG